MNSSHALPNDESRLHGIRIALPDYVVTAQHQSAKPAEQRAQALAR
jgi:hypothetical protein